MNLKLLLDKALAESPLDRNDLARLISPADEDERRAIAAAARELRGRYSGDLVYPYGFVYLSTWCRNDCRFCSYRKGNPEALRYRKSAAEVVEAARRLADEGVNLIDLTMGEDPATDTPEFTREIADLIASVKQATGRPVMLSPGVVSAESLAAFRRAGADWYACYQETHNPELFARLRQGQSFDKRRLTRQEAVAQGYLVEDGALCGVGETALDLADSILAMKNSGAAQVRAMGFVPPAEALTDESGRWVPAPEGRRAQAREIDMIAALRLACPDLLIPASLDVEGLAGLEIRLAAGANVVTSLVPAGSGMAGVAQASLDIDNNARSIAGVRPVAEAAGLKLAAPADYLAWLERRRSDGL